MIDIIIVNPIFSSRVIGGIYVDAFYPAAILGKQGFKGKKVIPFYDEITGERLIRKFRLYAANS
jgi:hypothetical protein